ncbi:MAG: glycosyltransferase [Candidatus Saccharimonadaceae bacterium]
MATLQKILVFCPPFSGHFNVLRELIAAQPNQFDWKLVITGWSNISLDLGSLADITTVLAQSPLNEIDPALWTLPRAAELLDQCLDIASDFQPDLIIYDFFSIEGKFVGDSMNIPAWSSLPAFVGKFENKNYLLNKLNSADNKQALETLSNKYSITLKNDQLEMVSDGIHLPGILNVVWSYKSVTPADFMIGRHEKSYVFVGNPKELLPKLPPQQTQTRPTIYVSFGTVVMDNLWNQQDELRENLKQFIASVSKRWESKPWNIIFVTQGKKVLDSYPDNWTVYELVNQVDTLTKADVFVTHGGSNSFHESLLAGTPMVVVPFFGDQPLVARNVTKLGVGINLIPDAGIDTHASKTFLNEDLAHSLDTAVCELLNNPTYKQTIKAINFHHEDIYKLIEGKIDFKEGDLLFGTNIARKKYVDENDVQTEFTILEFKAFSELAPHTYSLPRIVDIYHDVILNDEHFSVDTKSELLPYISHLKDYKAYLAGETDFERMCIKGIDFFSNYHKINFILSDYDPSLNHITKAEINHILDNEDRLKNSVTFYTKLNGRWRTIDYAEVRRIQAI